MCLSFLTVVTEEYDRILILKEPVSNRALEGHVIRTEKVPDDGSCRVKCYLEPNCMSINVGPTGEGDHVCELNNATDESPSLSGLVERQRYTYYGVENPCHCNTCPSKYEVCQVGFTDKGFRCVCHQEYKKNQCEKDYHKALGMENHEISNGQISASSKHSTSYAAHRGRLRLQGAWSPARSDKDKWLQVDLISNYTRVTGVATQGRNHTFYNRWVTKYKLQYSDDGTSFEYYREPGQTSDKEFAGNKNKYTVVYHELNPPISARYIRFRPTAQHFYISMRVEVYGCRDPVPGIESLSGSSYMLFTAPETWNNASDSCKCLGAQLVKIESAAENNFLKRTFLTSSGLSFWIGLNDQIDEGKWKWTDGTPLEIYNNWSNGNPNNYGGNQNCGHITMGNISVGGYTLKNFDGKWNDLNCNFALGYICEKIYP
ncbi:hypothetical protein ACROYT_G022960 [Oculina patagonica]